MRAASQLFRRLYGDRVLHLIVLLAALALAAYVISVLGLKGLYNPKVWWQSIGVWFAVAVIGHDLVLFPLYALAERLLPTARRPDRPDTDEHRSRRVALTNYLRIPTMAAGLMFLLFFPGIIEQGAVTYHNATGLTQAPFLNRWLLLTALVYFLSAVWYVAKTVLLHYRHAATATRSTAQSTGLPTTHITELHNP
jgi:hypothetical protein